MVTADLNRSTAARDRYSAHISAIGSYVPDRVLSNRDLEAMIDTNDEWIVQRTGIRERRIAAEDEYTSDLCIAAVSDLIARYDANIRDVEFIIVCTSTPEFGFPSTAALVQARFGIPSAGAIDLSAACAGFVYGLHMAHGMIASGLHRKVLVIGADTMSKITDYTDRTTCILFGDGAGAVLVERSGDNDAAGGFLGHYLTTDGSGGAHVYRAGLSTNLQGAPLTGNGAIVQNGREVYRWAVTTVPLGMTELLQRSRMKLNDVTWFVPHSANMRMIESICEKSGFPLEQTLTSLTLFGNTSAATIPLSIDLAVRNNKLNAGDRLLLYGFGAGLTQAGMLVEWGL